MAALGLWSGVTLGKLDNGPRDIAIVLASLWILIGVIDVVLVVLANNTAPTNLSIGLVPGLVLVVGNVLIVYGLGFDGNARAAFRAFGDANYSEDPAAGHRRASGRSDR